MRSTLVLIAAAALATLAPADPAGATTGPPAASTVAVPAARSSAVPVPPAATTGVTDWVTPPRPAGTTAAYLDYKVHPHPERDIWVEEHLALGEWHTVVNGLPLWQYVFHTRIDQPTDIQVHYGACASGRPCIRLFDGFLGQVGPDGKPEYLALTKGWWDSSGRISGWVAITFNDSYFAPGSPNYTYDDDESRGPVLCHEYGHAVGLFYHRTTNDSCMLDPSPQTGHFNYLGSRDVTQLNAVY
jgi:hypothetical protein